MKVLVTGSNGFVGKNLIETLKNIQNGKDRTRCIVINSIYTYDLSNDSSDLLEYTKDCDFVIHLAGINRSQNSSDFFDGNKGFTETLCSYLKKNNNRAPVLISSSIQVGRDNEYAKSKAEGEDLIKSLSLENGNPVYVYRFANLFGKWCKPNYNSVVATWCYNLANGIDIEISDRNAEIPLCYIDDVIVEILSCLEGKSNYNGNYYQVEPIYRISLGELVDVLYSIKESRDNLSIVDQSNTLIKKLYATYLSYLPTNRFSYPLKMNIDTRGSFTEFIKTQSQGQVSINISKPGVTKGNHWHHTKNEKFLVVSGIGIIRFRKIGDNEIKEYKVSGEKLEVIDIPTGYTHSIENIGENDMVTVMWANELFNPEKPDTYFEEV